MIRKQLTDKSGATLIFVIIAAVLLLIVGTAVLIFASSNLVTTNKTIQNKSAYYVAKSTINTVKGSLTDDNGQIGSYILGSVLDDLKSSGAGENEARTRSDWSMTPTISLSSTAVGDISDYTISDVKITFSSTATPTTGSGSSVTKASVSIDDLVIQFKVTDGSGNTYHLNAKFNYAGTYDSGNWAGTWKTLETTNN